jgi:hypothetical protein
MDMRGADKKEIGLFVAPNLTGYWKILNPSSATLYVANVVVIERKPKGDDFHYRVRVCDKERYHHLSDILTCARRAKKKIHKW